MIKSSYRFRHDANILSRPFYRDHARSLTWLRRKSVLSIVSVNHGTVEGQGGSRDGRLGRNRRGDRQKAGREWHASRRLLAQHRENRGAFTSIGARSEPK